MPIKLAVSVRHSFPIVHLKICSWLSIGCMRSAGFLLATRRTGQLPASPGSRLCTLASSMHDNSTLIIDCIEYTMRRKLAIVHKQIILLPIGSICVQTASYWLYPRAASSYWLQLLWANFFFSSAALMFCCSRVHYRRLSNPVIVVRPHNYVYCHGKMEGGI